MIKKQRNHDQARLSSWDDDVFVNDIPKQRTREVRQRRALRREMRGYQ